MPIFNIETDGYRMKFHTGPIVGKQHTGNVTIEKDGIQVVDLYSGNDPAALGSFGRWRKIYDTTVARAGPKPDKILHVGV